MIIRSLFEGGITFMLPIYLMWISVFVLAVRFFILKNSQTDLMKLKKINDSILFIGSFAFLFGALGQILGLINAFDSVQRAGDISPALLAGGLKVSFLAPLFGFVLLLISGLFWFFFRNFLQSKQG